MTLTLRPPSPPTIIGWTGAATRKDPGGDGAGVRLRKDAASE